MSSSVPHSSGSGARQPAGAAGPPPIPLLTRLQLWVQSFRTPELVAGRRAEFHFEALAQRKRWALERVDQSRESMDKYRALSSRSVKRGDYLCRNCQNVEIELKCKKLYIRHNEPFFYMDYSEIKRLEEMQAITGTPVVLAFMERDGSDARPGSLRMAKLDFVLNSNDNRRGLLYDERSKCLRIPFKYTRPGFEVLRLLGGTGDA